MREIRMTFLPETTSISRMFKDRQPSRLLTLSDSWSVKHSFGSQSARPSNLRMRLMKWWWWWAHRQMKKPKWSKTNLFGSTMSDCDTISIGSILLSQTKLLKLKRALVCGEMERLSLTRSLTMRNKRISLCRRSKRTCSGYTWVSSEGEPFLKLKVCSEGSS